VNVEITIPAQSVTIPSQEVTVSIPAAQIVYQNSWLNQTSEIPSWLDVFTPSSEGIYRVSVAIFAYGTGTYSAGGDLYYPGPGGASFSSYHNPNNPSASINTCASFTFSPLAGVSVQLRTSISGALSYYNLYVTIEQLQ
jgi:hypothetical protein